MKVYLASWYASREEMSQRAEELRAEGIGVTSRWLEETVKTDAQLGSVDLQFKIETARIDIEDILLASVLVLNTPSYKDLVSSTISLATWARGGRHFESGFQYATAMFAAYLPAPLNRSRKLIVIGREENIFHYLSVPSLKAMGLDLPTILICPTWEDAKCELIRMQQSGA